MSPSGFHAWRTRPESPRAREDRRLKVLVHASFTGGRGYYGSPRIYDDFVEWRERVSRKRIIRLMQEEGLKARVRKRYKGTTMSDHDQPVADNLLRQEFTAERPNPRGHAQSQAHLRDGAHHQLQRHPRNRSERPSPDPNTGPVRLVALAYVSNRQERWIRR